MHKKIVKKYTKMFLNNVKVILFLRNDFFSAQNHRNNYQREKWIEAITSEYKNMIKRKAQAEQPPEKQTFIEKAKNDGEGKTDYARKK